MLKKLLSNIVSTATRIGRRKLEKISNSLLARLVMIFINAGEDIMQALLDDDPNNEKQILDLVKKHARRVVAEGATIGREKLDNMQDKTLRSALIAYMDGAEDMLEALLDDNPDNETQLKALWEQRKKILLGETMDIATDKIAELIRKKITDPTLAELIISIVQSLDELVKEPDPLPQDPNYTTTIAAPAARRF